MKKSILLLDLVGFNSCAQSLTCDDFKNGSFLIPADSLVAKSYKIERRSGQQIEFDEKGNKSIIDIKYIDDCNYILTINPNSPKKLKSERLINEAGGINVKVTEIKGDTLFYIGRLENDTLQFEQPGRIIKLK